MRTWQQSLKILLEEIKLPVAELAKMTDTDETTIFKFIQGKLNSKSGTVQGWLEGCERYRKGSTRMFYLICMEESLHKEKHLSVIQHVEQMPREEFAEYLKAFAARLADGRDAQQQSKDRFSQ
jgi:predicted transcriptional regulator